MTHKAVLFDLDGTLLDTLQDLATSTNVSLAKLGFPQHEVESYKNLIGEGREALARMALPDGHSDEATVAKLAAMIFDEYSRRWADTTGPYPGVPELLDTLTKRGMPMVVLSNKPHDSTEVTVGKLLSRWKFKVVWGAGSSRPRKPDPTGALEIARLIGVPPEEFLYLGDTDIDMKTAVAAGMFPVGVLWGFRTAEELSGAGAKVLIEHPRELLRFLTAGQ